MDRSAGKIQSVPRLEFATTENGHLCRHHPLLVDTGGQGTLYGQKAEKIIADSEMEGAKGFSGHDSITIFNEFYTTYAKEGTLINMAMVCNFFRQRQKDLPASPPEGFLDSLVSSYNYMVLQEVKESLYYYNEERVSKDIQNYLYAVNFEPGRTGKSVYTGEVIDISEDFFEAIERSILGPKAGAAERRTFREEVQNQYTAKNLTQEILIKGKSITATSAYEALRERYIHNLQG